MTKPSSDLAKLLWATRFAAEKHRDRRRKDRDASPYINHPVAVAELLARTGSVTDLVVLQAAMLHDTIEDTQTSRAELDREFGVEVRQLVEEVTDDKSLSKQERKRLQIEHAPSLSMNAKQIKLADKICNIIDVADSPPADWPLHRRQDYLEWAKAVVQGCRGCNPALEREFDRVIAAAASVFRLLAGLERGVDVKVIAEWQGHRDGGKLILQTYSHVNPVHSNRMAQLMVDAEPENVVPMPKGAAI
jgi:guanosine-3',5'-bis(diphosphate) 3'-pyrophosphohydrolase